MKSFYILLFFAALLAGCEKDIEFHSKDYPYVVTKEVRNIDATGATLEAEILDRGALEILDFGFLITDEKKEHKYSIKKKGSLNNFSMRLSADMETGITYYCRAYAQTARNLVLGNQVRFESVGSLAPEILDFNPKSGFDGTQVKLTGKYFSADSASNKILINDIPAELIFSSLDSVIFRIPSNSIIGNVSVSIIVGSKTRTATVPFNILGPDVTSMSVNSAYSGEVISLFGSNFLKNGASLSVTFGQYEAEVIHFTDTKVEVVVPVPVSNLLEDGNYRIHVINGKKRGYAHEYFLIMKSWEKKTPAPFDWHWEYEAFSYDNKGFILELNTKDLYEYDPETDQWNPIPLSTFLGDRYQGSLYLVSGDKLFKVGGYNHLQEAVNELWVFDFKAGSWTRKNDLPFGFLKATSFSLNNQFFVVTNERQVWKCDFESEEYTRMNDFPGNFGFFELAASFHVNGKAFIVEYGRTWQYNEFNDSWTEKATNPFMQESYRQRAFGFEYKNAGYVLHSGEYLYKYDAVFDKWILVSHYPASLSPYSYKVAFIIGEKAYIPAITAHYMSAFPYMYCYQGK